MNIKFVILFCLFTIGLNAQQPAETAPGLVNPDDQNGMTGNQMPFGLSFTDSLQTLPSPEFLKYSYDLFAQPFDPLKVSFKPPQLTPKFDYSTDIYTTIPLNTRTWISTARTNDHYIGLGGISTAGARYNYRINDFMTYSGGASFSKFNVYNQFYNDISFSNRIRFALSDRVFIHLTGTYAPLSAGRSLPPIFLSMYPQTSYGGSVEFKVTDSWGVMTGMEREFDPFRGKWVNRPFIFPVFYGK